MNLTESEKKLFASFKRAKGKDVSIAEVKEVLSAPSRQAAIVRIKYFASKVAPHGWIITRTSSTGRGVTGTYKMEKKF